MKIDTSFDAAFLTLQNGVNKAKTAADQVLEAVGGDKVRKVTTTPEMDPQIDTGGVGGINVSV